MAEICHLASQSEIRSLKNALEKAVVLHCEYSISYQKLADYFQISRYSIIRGVKARKEGREVGVNGRPFSLLPAEEIELIHLISSWKDEHQEDMSISDFLNQVMNKLTLNNLFEGRVNHSKEKKKIWCGGGGDH